MTSGPRRFRSGYRSGATEEWVLGTSDSPDAIVGYYDPDADQWVEGIADIESGEWIPVDAVRAGGGRDCPPGFPVKGNLPSRVFHTPGQQDYDRTTPEVCFASEAAAADAGFRHSRLGAGAAAAAAPAAAPRLRRGARGRMLVRPRHHRRRDKPLHRHRLSLIGTGCGGSSAHWRSPRCSGGSSSGRSSRQLSSNRAGGDCCRSRGQTPEEEEEDEAPAGIVATPAMASPVSGGVPPRWGQRMTRPLRPHLDWRRRSLMRSRPRRPSSRRPKLQLRRDVVGRLKP